MNEALLHGRPRGSASSLSGRPGPLVCRAARARGSRCGSLAFALYYRHFVGDVFALGSRICSASGRRPRGARPPRCTRSRVSGVCSDRADEHVLWLALVGTLAVLGLFLAGRRSASRRSSHGRGGLAYLGLILLRAQIPDVFRYGHETLFLTPLVALLAGVGPDPGLAAGRGGGWASVAAGIALSIESFGRQWPRSPTSWAMRFDHRAVSPSDKLTAP